MKTIKLLSLFFLFGNFCSAKNIYWTISSKASEDLLPLIENDSSTEKETLYSKNCLLKDFKKIDCTYKTDHTVRCAQKAIVQFIKRKNYIYSNEEKDLINLKLKKNHFGFFENLPSKLYNSFWAKIGEFVTSGKLFVKCTCFKTNEIFHKTTANGSKRQLLSFFKDSSSSSSNEMQIKENILALASCEDSFTDEEVSDIEPIVVDYVGNSDDKDPIFEEIRNNGLFVPDFQKKKQSCSIQ